MTLSETWFSDGRIDFELQKYRLLAYLQEADRAFNEAKLYPTLADLVFHYRNLLSFRDTKQVLQSKFPKTLNGLDLEATRPVYQPDLTDTTLMQELESIVAYGIDQLKPMLDQGTQLYDFVESQLHLEPIGLMPLYQDEGYVLLRRNLPEELRAYRYTTSIFEHGRARYRGLHLNYIATWTQTRSWTPERVKGELLKTQRELPQPAVYAVSAPPDVPLEETLLPVTKRLLIRHLATEKGTP